MDFLLASRVLMKRNSEIQKIAFVGDYLPRRCGIATFTYDVCTSVATQYPGSDCFVVPINDIPQGYDYPAEVRFEVEEQELDSYLRQPTSLISRMPILSASSMNSASSAAPLAATSSVCCATCACQS